MNNAFRFVIPVIFCILCCAVPAGLLMLASQAETVPEVPYTLKEEEFLLPEVLYLSGEEAVSQLSALGLHVEETEKIHHPVIPEGCILMQSPSAGTVMQKDDTVILSVSAGWKETVPDLCGTAKEEAVQKLESLGFSAEYQEQENEAASGTVIAQSVPADTQKEYGSTVLLTVSAEREILPPVPDCTGKNTAEARQILEDAGYVCMIIYTASGDIPLDTVISQDVSEAEAGSRVWLTASTGTASSVISTGGWSGNPLPSFGPETEAPPEELPEIVPAEQDMPKPEEYEEAPEFAPD